MMPASARTAMMRLPRKILLVIARCLLAAGLCSTAVGAQPADEKTRLDSIGLQLQQVEAMLQRRDLSDAQLLGARGTVEPMIDELRTRIAEATPKLDGVKSRLEQLGPAPDTKGGAPPASPEVNAERDAQLKLQKEIDDSVRIARFQYEKASQILGSVAERRRALFASALLERSTPLVSPVIWLDAARNGPAEVQHFLGLMRNWWDVASSGLTPVRGVIIVALLALLLLIVPRLRRLFFRFEGRPSDVAEPMALPRALRAIRVSFGAALVPAAAAAGAYVVLDGMDLLPDRVTPIVLTVFTGTIFVLFVRAIAMGVIPISKPAWRVFSVDDALASELQLLVSAIATTLVVGKVLEAITQAIVSPLTISILIKGCVAVFVALLTMRVLRSFKVADDKQIRQEEECYGQQTTSPVERGNWLRIVGWLVTTGIVAAAASGYVALASFIAQQMAWIAIVVVISLLLLGIIDEAIGRGISSEGRLGRQIHEAMGLRSGSVDQIGILASGGLRLTLIVVAAFLVLAPWGIDSGDLAGYLKAAFFGFSVAGFTISVSSIATALIILGVGLFVTRSVQRWLDLRYLPHTGLDVGLRNSIKTIFGYVGILFTAAIAFAQAGLSLDKLTIVAGALSVGIGFGLQSIVNNFVSGLILLWERPLRVGDWIVVAGEEGVVKRINVRATEIETFDKASLIVPNSEFISGRVKNWMHSNRQARIVIPISVGRSETPKHVEQLLLAAAAAHRAILAEPQARVFFMKISEASIDFELRCFTDVDTVATTRSELMFSIYDELHLQGVELPNTAPVIGLGDIHKLSATIAARVSQESDDRDGDQRDGPVPEPAKATIGRSNRKVPAE